MASLSEIMQAMADRLDSVLTPLIDDLQVAPLLRFNPTPPAIDIYPAEPFQENATFGKGNNEVFFLVRARVSTAEHEGGQLLLLSMMDPRATTSVARALETDRTLGGTVDHVAVDPPEQYRVFVDPGANPSALLGCTWRVRVIL